MSAEFLHALSALSALSTPSTNNPTDAATNLFLVIEPVDMRLGIDGLSSCIQTRLPGSPCAGGIYIFSNARRNRLKLLLWDATGVWLAQRRLHQGRFIVSVQRPHLASPAEMVYPNR